jgi:hypothetical protein
MSKAPRISSAALKRLGHVQTGELDKVTATRPGRATKPPRAPEVATVQTLTIDKRLPGLNDMIDAAKQTQPGRNYVNRYTTMKAQWSARLARLCRLQGIQPVGAAHLHFVWIEPNRKRDPDNVCAAKKFCIDALVTAGILTNDGWAQVLSMTDTFRVVKGSAGVIVTIDSRTPTTEEA